MAKAKNILFIMFDQLRWDYLSCYGHPHLQTPNIDRLAAKGVRFDRAYIQSPVCGSSRMSTYTGRYVQSHGATYNGVPLKVGEMTLGDHLRPLGMGTWLVGKTHMRVDHAGMERLGIDRGSIIGARVAECGFDVFERDDGMLPQGPDGDYDPDPPQNYNAYLAAQGYPGDNPWHDHANSGVGPNGEILSGWFMKNSPLAANIDEEDSETPYMTRRGIAFMEQAEGPWCCHLSYIKPHWPYIVPAPYHDMYGPEHCLAPVRSQAEFDTAHPFMKAYMTNPISTAFSQDHVRAATLPAYMGLIKQADDQMGLLFDWMEKTGRMDDTMIVLTSDHGDFLGDHWMGEKQFFHDTSTKVPLIIYDPSPEADATRGTVSDALVEQIDLAPTFVEVAGGEPASHILEGHSLLGILHGQATEMPRKVVICENDYSLTLLPETLGLSTTEAYATMVANKRWKLTHFGGGYRPILWDLENDPDELVDLGESPDHPEIIAEMYSHLHAWAMRIAQRTTMSDEQIIGGRRKGRRKGILIGLYDENEIPAELTVKVTGRTTVHHDKREKPGNG